MQTHLIEGEAGIRRRNKRRRRIMAEWRIGDCTTPRSPPLLIPRPSIPRRTPRHGHIGVRWRTRTGRMRIIILHMHSGRMKDRILMKIPTTLGQMMRRNIPPRRRIRLGQGIHRNRTMGIRGKTLKGNRSDHTRRGCERAGVDIMVMMAIIDGLKGRALRMSRGARRGRTPRGREILQTPRIPGATGVIVYRRRLLLLLLVLVQFSPKER